MGRVVVGNLLMFCHMSKITLKQEVTCDVSVQLVSSEIEREREGD